MVVGGLAVARLGWERNTDDADILIDADPANVSRLIASLHTFTPAAGELHESDFSVEEGAVRIVGAFGLDVFTQMTGKRYADVRPTSVPLEVLEETVLLFSTATL